MNVTDITGQVEYNDTLNPRAWKDDRLRPDVRLALLKAARIFIDYLDVENFRLLDIVLTGSIANYNYTRYSDFDLHILTRYSDLRCDNLAEAFYRAKKSLWNDQHDITIAGHDVELYVEDIDQPPVSSGVYSVLDDRWIKHPEYAPPSIDDRALALKVSDLVQQIDQAISNSDNPDDVQRIVTKLRKMRQSGLEATGEFGIENLAFKVLRNMDYISRLHQELTRRQDEEISI